ncbi:fumarate hydratase [Brevibacillus choshinensis]|uniref:fumarate hydratase n=1 Tax=Brevibacillus choshinensis TaxID=54911 RepID=UPI002E22E1A6|nr:fumarate hydratase [Brevibacillus choshinensis]MED4753590.1 fumarate hydratase [Brevibacillus choshinensis]MED4781978.1 fumarate hydratase [Brevibacillus choshinensis]
MREVTYEQIVDAVKSLCIEANVELGPDVVAAMREAKEKEKSAVADEVLSQLLQNAEIAASERVPMCQDTGMAVFLVELGQDCHIVGGSLYDAVNEGIRRGYGDGYLRASIVHDPILRKNTGDNTPGIVHVELVAGDACTIHMTAKGFGSENMSRLQMMKPSDGIEAVKAFVVETVRLAGPNACPPVVVGVGLGGNFEMSAYLAKRALFRPIGERNSREDAAELELALLEQINQLGLGPQGMGGRTTALDVHVELYATHIAGLPVAVNINCHASRHKHVTL